MNPRLQYYYLQEMGINRWVKRSTNNQDKTISASSLKQPSALISCKRTDLSSVLKTREEINDNLLNKQDILSQLAEEVSQCMRCELHQSRKQTVFSRGNPHAKLMIIGEAPGFFEDKAGLPFVGKAGKLLDEMLKSIGFDESTVYIANVLKCRPPDNRDPKVQEIEQCRGYLDTQIGLVNPDCILGVGRFAAQFIINKVTPLGKLRQIMHRYKDIPCFISYHPAYLLRNPKDKAKAYDDLLQVKDWLTTIVQDVSN